MKTIQQIYRGQPQIQKKLKVAAYVRVSVESERMHHSLSAQISYYSGLIQKKPEWEYAGVYADYGISGTGIAKREAFKRMVARYDAAKKGYEDTTAKIYSQDARNEQLELFIRTLEEQGVVTEFDETLWATLLESITVYGKEDIRVKFRDGTVVKV